VRGDIAVMKKQLEELPEEFRPAYRALSQLIMSQHNIPYEQNQL
jgi:DNA-binding ferritin-like protein (Dps family)